MHNCIFTWELYVLYLDLVSHGLNMVEGRVFISDCLDVSVPKQGLRQNSEAATNKNQMNVTLGSLHYFKTASKTLPGLSLIYFCTLLYIFVHFLYFCILFCTFYTLVCSSLLLYILVFFCKVLSTLVYSCLLL